MPGKLLRSTERRRSLHDHVGVDPDVTSRRHETHLVRECVMPLAVDFKSVSTVGLELSPVATALAGLRANEARYFKNKYDHVFTVEPASDAKSTIDWVHRVLEDERDIVISSRPLEATAFQVGNIRWTYACIEEASGLPAGV
jgi:hypothetical protein